MASSLTDEPPKASLLGIPAEIRNRIYELVLINYAETDDDEDDIEDDGDDDEDVDPEEDVDYDDDRSEEDGTGEESDGDEEAALNNEDDAESILITFNPVEPGILRACRQTRQESRQMFFTRNRFSATIDFENPSTIPQPGHWCWFRSVYKRTCRKFTGAPHHPAALKYLHLVRQGLASGVEFKDYASAGFHECSDDMFRNFQALCDMAAQGHNFTLAEVREKIHEGMPWASQCKQS